MSISLSDLGPLPTEGNTRYLYSFRVILSQDRFNRAVHLLWDLKVGTNKGQFTREFTEKHFATFRKLLLDNGFILVDITRVPSHIPEEID